MTHEIPDWIVLMTAVEKSNFVSETGQLITAAETRGDADAQKILKHQLRLVWDAQDS